MIIFTFLLKCVVGKGFSRMFLINYLKRDIKNGTYLVNSLQARADPLKAQKFDLVVIHRTNKTYAQTKTNTRTYNP